MPLNIGDMIEVQYNFLQGTIIGKMIQYYEVFSYSGVGEAPIPELEFANSLFEKTKTVFGQLIGAGASYQNVYVRNRTNPLYEATSSAAAQVGTGGGTGASFVALKLRQQRQTTATRHGFKRFPFTGEAVVTGNTVTVSGTQLTFLRGVFGAVMDVEDPEAFYQDVQLFPVIIPRIGSPETGYTLDFDNPNRILQMDLQGITSQNTRKT